jgi:hypothetical protein
MVGAEYTPWRATNQLWWHNYTEYRADVVREVAAMKKALGFTTLRMFLHDMLFDADAEGLKLNMNDFLSILDQQGMRAGFVFFDDCWAHSGADLSKTCIPTQGVHNGCWVAGPQDVKRTDVGLFETYVSDIVASFKDDPRVAWWEIFNEPQKSNQFSISLRHAAFQWARAQKPSAPVISCWDDNEDTQVVDKHQYGGAWGHSGGVFANPAKGGIVTEAGCRWFQQDKDHGSPLTVVNWLEAIRRGGSGAPFRPGVMVAWEVMVGRSMTRWGWGSRAGDAEPAIPWCGMLYPDGSPVSYTEAGAFRTYLGQNDDFLYLNTFLPPSTDTTETFMTIEDGKEWKDWAPTDSLESGALYELAVWAQNGDGAITVTAGGFNVTVRVTKQPRTCSVGEYTGCFQDRKPGVVMHIFPPNVERPHMTPLECASLCKDANFQPYSHFGLERGKLCECGSDFNASSFHRNETLCMFPCSGDPSSMCGGAPPPGGYGDAVSVYSMQCDSDPSPELEVTEATPGGSVLKSVELGPRLVGQAWNLLRILAEPSRVRVWLNPTFDEITGSSVGDDAVKPHQPTPIIDLSASRDEAMLGLSASTSGGAWHVDYASVLPPLLFGTEVSSEIVV